MLTVTPGIGQCSHNTRSGLSTTLQPPTLRPKHADIEPIGVDRGFNIHGRLSMVSIRVVWQAHRFV